METLKGSTAILQNDRGSAVSTIEAPSMIADASALHAPEHVVVQEFSMPAVSTDYLSTPRVNSTVEADAEVFHQYNQEYARIKSNDKRYGYRMVKRALDIVFSGIVLACLLIPGLILSIAIMLESKGAPIYRQKRVGKDGKEFTMYKFRSMVKDADKQLDQLMDKNEADGPLFKMENDPRLTRIGRFIRKHSIDELPQFINSFIGNMSVVGPRPALPREVLQYNDYMKQRLYSKPGITGYWQTRGRSSLPFYKSINLDLRYIVESSFAVDVGCILKTIPVVFSGRNSF